MPAADDASDQDLVTRARPGPLTAESATSDDSTGIGGLWALFLGLGLMMIGNGLNGSLVGLRSGEEGFSLAVTGVIMAGYFAGFLLGPSAVVRIIPNVGHIRVFAGLASTASSVVLVHAVIVDPTLWVALRFVFGFCMAGLYVVIESWLNEMSSTANRGRTLAVYMLVTMGGLVIGQVLLTLGGSGGMRLFILASILVSMSLVPMTLAATTKQPAVRIPARTTVRELLGYVPTGVVGSFMVGTGTGALLGLGVVYATAVDMSIDRTAAFLAAPFVGAIIFQWPVGWVSDRFSRRAVIFVVAAIGGMIAAALALLPADSPAVLPLMVIFGGAIFSLYSLVVAYTLDWTPVDKTVAASGTLVRINGAGAVLGPLVGAAPMALVDASMFFWTLAGTQAVIVGYVGYRLIAKDAMPIERQRKFVLIPVRASQFVLRLAPKPRRRPPT